MPRAMRFLVGWVLALAIVFAVLAVFARGAAIELRERERVGRDACAQASANGLSLAGCPHGELRRVDK